MDWKKVEELIEQGYIRKRKHPTLPLWIYNYTHNAQFDKMWTPETLACRGIVADEQNKIWARPFEKFFNIEEHQYKFPEGPIEISEKMDGSLGILFRYDSELVFCSRGSFDSDQAREFEAIWREKHGHESIDSGKTYLFEIIYPENRIVVDYGQERKVVLLGIIETETQKEIAPITDPEVTNLRSVEICRFFDFERIEELLDEHTRAQFSNSEGFVVRHIESNFRVKVKLDEYVRLHKLITEASSVSIWETLANGDPIESMLEKVPDEFYQYVRNTRDELLKSFYSVKDDIKKYLSKVPNLSRKDQAIWIQNNVPKKLQGFIFSALDQRTYDDKIWKLIRPEYSKPFWQKAE